MSTSPPPLKISLVSVLQVLALLALVLLLYKTMTILLLLFLGLLLAVSLEPLVQRIQRFGAGRGLAIASVAAMFLLVFAGVFTWFLPALYAQAVSLVKAFPAFRQSALLHIRGTTAFRETLTQMLNDPQIPDATVLVTNSLTVVNAVFGSVAQTLLVLIFSLYLLVDGKRAFKWISDFFTASTRLKLSDTAEQTSLVIHAYVRGQVITSCLSFAFTLTALKLLEVPGALLLAAMAGVLDVLPILGFILALVPAVLLGFTVSVPVGLAVLGLYVLYHAVENYLIVPWVYGSSMKVSSLVVLLALLVATTVGGILGALAVLPIVASYPIIERIWLVKYLGRDVVSSHAETEEIVPAGSA